MAVVSIFPASCPAQHGVMVCVAVKNIVLRTCVTLVMLILAKDLPRSIAALVEGVTQFLPYGTG